MSNRNEVQCLTPRLEWKQAEYTTQLNVYNGNVKAKLWWMLQHKGIYKASTVYQVEPARYEPNDVRSHDIADIEAAVCEWCAENLPGIAIPSFPGIPPEWQPSDK